ncbi:hypothetical protein [Phocaeicola dorei]
MTIANRLNQDLRKGGYTVNLHHRDVDKAK